MKIISIFFATFFTVNLAYSQQAIYTQSFTQLNKNIKTTASPAGIALDLTANAPLRQPLIVANALAGHSSSFSVSAWVKAAKSQQQAYVFLKSSRKVADSSYGWQMGTQPGGAWYCKTWFTKNNKGVQYDYTPTIHQKVNDGKWHQIILCYDTTRQEMAIYFDGKNRALLYTPGLKQLMADTLLIGGEPAGQNGEWETFNGYIGEIKMYKQILPNATATAFNPNKTAAKTAQRNTATFKVMNFNIRWGGHETGKEVGVQRVVDVIKASGADIVSMQETYGSGPEIADALGFYFYLRSSNLAIYSRYPIRQSLPAGTPFNSGGAIIDMPGGKPVALFTNWLPYPFDYWDMLEKGQKIDSVDWYNQQYNVNAENLRQTLNAIAPAMAMADREHMPVIFGGDLNTGSHLDWTEATRHLNGGYLMPFPSTRIMQQQGFTDSYRKMHPNPLTNRGITWSPMFLTAFKDRIDYIFYRSEKISPIRSVTISTHPVKYPSDHAALLTTFEWKK